MVSYTLPNTFNKDKVFLIHKSELEKRLDPLYYYEDVFGFLKNIKYQIKTINKISKYTISGFGVGREEQDLTEQGYIQIRPTNLNDFGLLKFDRNVYLDDSFIQTKKENIIQKNDILFNNTNSQDLVGKTAFFDLDGIYFHSNHITRIRVDENCIRPKFLWILLNIYQQKKIFYTICTNWNNQSGVGLELLNSLKIIVPSFEIQDKVISITEKSLDQKKQNEAAAEKFLESIDDYLLKELGITLPTPPENILKSRIFITSFKRITGQRYDPTYHRLNYEKFINSLKNSSFKICKLKDIILFLDYGLMPTQDYAFTEDEGLPIIRVTNIMKDGYINMDKVEYIKFDTPKLKDKIVQENDILMVQCGNTTGKCAMVTKKFVGYTYGSFSFAIRANPKIINQYFLFYLLNSKIVQEQLNRSITITSVRPNTSKPEVENFLIPVPPLAKQKEIAEHISEIRQQAQRLKDKTKEELKKAGEEIEKILLA